MLIVDEAHRLKGKGTYMYKGESQVDDVIRSSKCNVFFVDDFQRIRPNDEGTVKKIIEVAGKYNSEVVKVDLIAQFRCAGAEGFLNWIEHTLGISETDNFDGWDQKTFEFKLVDDPNALKDLIDLRIEQGFKLDYWLDMPGIGLLRKKEIQMQESMISSWKNLISVCLGTVEIILILGLSTRLRHDRLAVFILHWNWNLIMWVSLLETI